MPGESEVYKIEELKELSFASASRNPESYSIFAIAYDATKRSQADQNGNYIEFWTGYATQG